MYASLCVSAWQVSTFEDESAQGEAEINQHWNESAAHSLEHVPPMVEIIDELKSILGDELLLSNLLKRAYWHPLGVWKFPLSDNSPTSVERRIHVWDVAKLDDVLRTYECHDHKWSFFSRVICGKFQFRIYEENPEGVQFTEFRMHSFGFDSERRTERIGKTGLLPLFSAQLVGGDKYYFRHSHVHEIYPTQAGISATYIQRSPYVSRTTRIFERTRDGEQRAESAKTKRGESSYLKSLLEKVVQSWEG